ncbi:MAG: response regulator [Nitrososphaeraceae archaeon]
MISGLLEKGKRIMIVDDDSDCTFTIKIVLERYGFKVYSYNNAYLALGAYRSNFYDLVILDIILPEMNGFQLYREIKKIDKKVKVCFLSAGQLLHGTYSDVFSKIDASYFIRKPIGNQSLIQKIEEIIEVNCT